MEQDYLLIAIDSEKKFAIRFLCLKHGLTESLAIKNLPSNIALPYSEFVLASVLLGSRMNDQESVLYKAHFQPSDLRINCEVNPSGAFRTAVFPEESLNRVQFPLKGLLQVTVLNKKGNVYTTPVEISHGVVPTFQNYLSQSLQTPCLFFVHADPENTEANCALWIERLPGTTDTEWNTISLRFKEESLFLEALNQGPDPDRIMSHLFGSAFQILAVTMPKLTCACSLEAFEDAIAALSVKDLVELFMEGKGIESRCDYCGKVWKLSDDFVSNLLKTTTKPQ